jgi:hypothetical protein
MHIERFLFMFLFLKRVCLLFEVYICTEFQVQVTVYNN